ncbi:MAG: type II toxin-antitoxin system VapC family toxin [Planctomycetes bacterium]|nr:type II toxin-antitoxin system VapC family toxin [Planctomycetota bacterium]
MKYVLDASVALAWVIPRPMTLKADALRDDYRNAIHELIAPSTFPAEIASGLTKAERQKIINVGEAIPFLTDILSTVPVLQAYDPLLFRVAEISSKTRSGLHDCLYIALAEREGCEFVTVDDKLLKNVQKDFPFVIHLGTV